MGKRQSMTVDKNSPNPLYLQLKKLLENDIVSGRLAPNQLLPSERELCRRYEVSQITVRQAFKELETIGLVLRVPGKGPSSRNGRRKPTILPGDRSFCRRYFEPTRKSYILQLLAGVKAEGRSHKRGQALAVLKRTSDCDLARSAHCTIVGTNP